MFIEQSVARRRGVRLLFVAAALLPCACLAAVAWWRQSEDHAAAVVREAAAHLGMPVAIGRVVHPRPGVMRFSDVALGDALMVTEVEVEATAAEVRVRVPRVDCSPATARTLAEVIGEWLRHAARYPRSWVVDVADVAWLPRAGERVGAGGWHCEFVAAGDARAVWLRREPATTDGIRVRLDDAGLAVEAALEAGVPASIASAFTAGNTTWAGALGPQAMLRGTLQAVQEQGAWTGKAAGAIECVDLASACPGGGRRLQGEATLTVAALEFAAGRLERCDFELAATGGAIAQDLLDDVVSSLGCRPGPAYRALGGDSLRRFDRLSCRVLIDADGLRLRSPAGSGSGLVASQGLTLLEESATAVPPTRLAWLLSPAGRPPVPASAASGWLISVLPADGAFCRIFDVVPTGG